MLEDASSDVPPISLRDSGGLRAGEPGPVTDSCRGRAAPFGVIGAGVFLGGLGLLALMVQALHLAPLPAYACLAVASIEASFLLNRRFTWPERDVRFLDAWWRFHAQRAFPTAVRVAAYGGLVWLGLNYLAATVLLAAVFTAVNCLAGDRWPVTSRRRQARRRASNMWPGKAPVVR